MSSLTSPILLQHFKLTAQFVGEWGLMVEARPNEHKRTAEEIQDNLIGHITSPDGVAAGCRWIRGEIHEQNDADLLIAYYATPEVDPNKTGPLHEYMAIVTPAVTAFAQGAARGAPAAEAMRTTMAAIGRLCTALFGAGQWKPDGIRQHLGQCHTLHLEFVTGARWKLEAGLTTGEALKTFHGDVLKNLDEERTNDPAIEIKTLVDLTRNAPAILDRRVEMTRSEDKPGPTESVWLVAKAREGMAYVRGSGAQGTRDALWAACDETLRLTMMAGVKA